MFALHDCFDFEVVPDASAIGSSGALIFEDRLYRVIRSGNTAFGALVLAEAFDGDELDAGMGG